jgi:hypothetical protein
MEDKIMSKYRVVFEGEVEERLYDTYEEANDAALYLCSCSREGAETLHMSNPGDYDYDEDEECEYVIEEID